MPRDKALRNRPKTTETGTAAGLLAQLSKRPVDRRSFLGLMGGVAVAASIPAALTACGAGGSTATITSSSDLGANIADLIPNHYPISLATPDIPGVNGSTPGFTSLPAELTTSVASTPGKGGTYTAMSPAWWTVPPALPENSYYAAVNKELGATVNFQVNDGNTYADKIQTVLASPKDVPDWVVIPSWNLPPRFGQAAESLFTDLSEYLAGDKVKKYPNLANLPTDAWKYSVFNGGLYGLPYPGTLLNDALFFRADLFEELGLQQPTSAAEYLEVAKEATDESKSRWGSEDVWNLAQIMHGVAPMWQEVDGKLQHKLESDQYRAALEWTAKLFASGAVHPDAVAGNSQMAKSRFESGAVLMTGDGLGSWHEALARVLPTNPKFRMQAMDYFAPDGGTPELYKASPASIFSFIKKNEDKAKIEEILALADYMAAPFGTVENQLITNGVEGVHYTPDSQNVPQATDKGRTEVTSTYAFLVSPPIVNSMVQYPGYVKERSEWEARQAPHVKESLFFGLQIQEDTKFASLGKPFDDLAKDIARGRKSISDLDSALATWKKSGGDELRDFYAGFLNA